jgi:hypothetical protein
MVSRFAAIVLGAMLAAALPAPAAAAERPAGLGLDEAAEKRLSSALDDLLKLAGAEKSDYAGLVKGLAAPRKEAAGLVALAEKKEPAEPDGFKLPEKVPAVLLGEAKADEVRALWQGQLLVNLKAARDLLAGEPGTINEWVSGDRRAPANRARAAADALREAGRSAALLARPVEEVRVKKGEQLFTDDFAKGAANWDQFGQCVTANEGDAFRFKDEKPAHPDAMIWTRKEFDGDFLAEFLFIPHSQGARPGALFTICGRPRPGKELAVCVGEDMDTYNFGIDGYHFSMHRGTTGLGNVRRVGPGLKMLASGKDPCPEVGKEYRVAIGKVGPTIFLIVDGQLVHSYYDAATYGPVLAAGRIGLRHWGGMDGSYKDFRVWQLVSEPGNAKQPNR